MKRTYAGLLAISAITASVLYIKNVKHEDAFERENEKEEQEFAGKYVKERAQYEYDLIKDPVTGKLPPNIFQLEHEFASSLPEKDVDALDLPSSASGTARATVLNTYLAAGPNNLAGRTRAVAYDRRYDGSANRVIIAGSVSGGIMRSADGGASWTRVTPENEYHGFTALAQDPTNPDIWYAGGGEPYGSSQDEIGAAFLGYGILKSTNNGVSWSRLPLNTITNLAGTGILGAGQPEAFDHPFDYVHRIVVNPANGDLYIAGHRRLVKSTDKGATFRIVFESANSAFSSNGQMDLVINNTGSLFMLAVNGGAATDKRGVWVSNSGDVNSWARIAGGQTLGVDSVAGWRGNSWVWAQAGTPPQYESKRIVLTLAPSDNNIAYIYYENGLSSESPDLKPEADLFKLDISGNTYTWTNRSANMPDFPNGNLSGSDPLNVQGGYNMEVKVKPDNPNMVFLGATNMYRSTDGFATTSNTSWINGYSTSFNYSWYPGGHPDDHIMTFNPINPNEAITGDDGGIRVCSNIGAPTVSWTPYSKYQTLQYYYIGIDPGAGRNNFVGGSQDNGVQIRDRLNMLQQNLPDTNAHVRLIGGDGCTVALSKLETNQYLYGSSQYGSFTRYRLTNTPTFNDIRPTNLTPAFTGATNEYGEFVTRFLLDYDNTEDLYYVNFNRLFRTTSASTVTPSSYTELTGVAQTLNPSNPTAGTDVRIRGMAISRGPYATSHALYLGTNTGKVFRLNDPRNAAATAAPVDISPSAIAGLNVQDIAVNPNDDNEVMLVVSNYAVGATFNNVVNIWWTNNAKSATPTWRQAEGNLAGTTNSGYISGRSCAIVVKKDASNNAVTEYYVGTAAGLYSTTNLGTTLLASGSPVWQREGGNVLNFAVVRSLAYRPADNVLLLGTHGNGMYYTNLGTPNVATGINDPILNDKNFIQAVYPTITPGTVQYRIGNLFSVKKISVQVVNMMGQVVVDKHEGYQNGTVNLGSLSRGNYILSITSDDRKYRHIQKINRQ